jgi:hypothetical protein
MTTLEIVLTVTLVIAVLGLVMLWWVFSIIAEFFGPWE